MAAIVAHTRRWAGDSFAQTLEGLPHGTALGCTECGVIGYNNNYKNIPEGDSYDGSHFADGVYLGMKWQCVEFARRYWLTRYNVIIPPVSWAAHIWNLTYVSRRNDYYQVPLSMHANGGNVKPQSGDLLIYGSTPNQRVGHVAVVLNVCNTEDGKEVVRVGEQNQENDVMWKDGSYADELELINTSVNTYQITHPDTDLSLLGWVRLELDKIVPRPTWTRQENVVVEDGSYTEETVKAFQRMLGANPDGSHGGFTNSSIRNFLRELSAPSDPSESNRGLPLLTYMRKFFVDHSCLCKSTERLTSVQCNRTDCVCSFIYPIKDRVALYEVAESDPVCYTTLVLQEFLNTIRHPYDVPSALNELKSI